MSKSIESAYQEVLQSQQPTEANTQGNNLRAHPRFQVKTDDLWISSVPDFSLLDISASGLAIRSNYPLEKGQVIEISLGNALQASATVVDCKLVSSADEWSEAEFRISCHYTEDLCGMELLVKAIDQAA